MRQSSPVGVGKVQLPSVRVSKSKYLENPVHAGLLYVCGQLPYDEGSVRITGIVGDSVDIDTAQDAARLCAMNALATISHDLGGLDMISRVIRLTGYVAAGPTFEAHPTVVDAASSVLVEVLGDRGRHARTAVGVSSLPRGAAVEIELVVAVVEGWTPPGA